MMSNCAPSLPPASDQRTTALEARLAWARSRRRPTIGEYVLRAIGYALAVAALWLTWLQAADAATLAPGPASCLSVARAPASRQVLLVAADATGLRGAQMEALQESVASYFGLRVHGVTVADYRRELLQDKDVLLVFANAMTAAGSFAAAMDDAAARALPVAWIGLGGDEFATRLGLETAPHAPAPGVAPPGTVIDYKGVRVSLAGMLLSGETRAASNPAVRSTANIRLPDGSLRAGVVRASGNIFVGFVPFTDLAPNLGLTVAVQALSALFEPRRPDPRVLLRLEDLNGRDYGWRDKSLETTTSYLLAQGVFMHLSITPLSMDATGKQLADIGNARGLLRLIERHPAQVEVVQHGTQHFRRHPRNHGKSSGEAYEFFFDDDATMGPQSAAAFAHQRLSEGIKVMARYGMQAQIFEAPHYSLSPAQQVAASALFPVMHHAPLHHAGIRSQLLLPWPMRRDDASYAPSMLGYVSIDDPNSVAGLLRLMEQLVNILPDPIVVIQYHPFMTVQKGRERDLSKLVEGAKSLGYRFANTCHELSRAAAPPPALGQQMPRR